MNVTLTKNDEIVMKLLHYFITIQGYNPVVLHGAKDEIWLENSGADYKIIRIVSNYIHNDEQLDFDIFRTKQILKTIKKKMFSFKMDTLSIFVNLGENVNLDSKDFNNIKCADVKQIKDLSKYSFIINEFPNILEVENTKEEGLQLFLKLTEDINKKNYEETKKAEEVFSKKKPIMTYIFMGISIVLYILTFLSSTNLLELDPNVLYRFGALVNLNSIGNNYIELYRLISSIFLHGGLLHLLCNMYSLYIIGPQLESFFGKLKYSIIFIGSGVIGNLLSLAFLQDTYVSVGASGAIFGLMGALVYFGYHYRVYLSGVIKTQIIPLILINLALGFMITSINNLAHIGGLIGGFLLAKAIGVKYKSEKSDIINGVIMTLIFVVFLIYLAFFR
ncbi:MAG: rhomboid family intramembrane serine protease [bacterium]|nr:rhomboid family intramembrane serine protease [bacterium]